MRKPDPPEMVPLANNLAVSLWRPHHISGQSLRALLTSSVILVLVTTVRWNEMPSALPIPFVVLGLGGLACALLTIRKTTKPRSSPHVRVGLEFDGARIGTDCGSVKDGVFEGLRCRFHLHGAQWLTEGQEFYNLEVFEIRYADCIWKVRITGLTPEGEDMIRRLKAGPSPPLNPSVRVLPPMAPPPRALMRRMHLIQLGVAALSLVAFFSLFGGAAGLWTSLVLVLTLAAVLHVLHGFREESRRELAEERRLSQQDLLAQFEENRTLFADTGAEDAAPGVIQP